jgi:benzoyl-CoA reductase/2-hydroxyglutaryl-CoA dehydratase subunit BcrC/BadD/HgdB
MPKSRTTDLAALAAELAAARAAQVSERSVGIIGRYVPPEIPAALGLEPALLTFSAGPAALREGEAFARTDSCPLCRAALGGLLGTEAWVRRLGLVIAGTACDQQRRMLEALGRYHQIPVFAFGVPRTCSANARRRYGEGLERLVRELEGRFGVRLEPDRLRAAVESHRRLRARLLRLRPSLGFGRFAELAADCLFLGAARAPELLDGADPPAADPPETRLLLAGSCLGREDAAFLAEALAASGADFVDDATGLLAGRLEVEVPSGTADVATLAAAYFDQPDIARRPNDAYYSWLKRKAVSSRADGVVFRFLKFCDLNAAERLRVREALAPLPVVFLDEEGGPGEAARRRTRLEALLESIRCPRA